MLIVTGQFRRSLANFNKKLEYGVNHIYFREFPV